MLPMNSQDWSLGTSHKSAVPRLSTTQQSLNIRPPINCHHCSQRCRLTGPSDDFYGDAPPPYYSLPPPGSIATGSTIAEVACGATHTCRRVKSESCASPYHSQDGDFLANIAAIQLLSGCTTVPRMQNSARRPYCGTGCDGIFCVCALKDFHLRILSKKLSKHPNRPLRIQKTLHGGADGHSSLESTDRVRMCTYGRSTPMTPSVSRERFPSEDLDRRLQSIENALHRDSFQSGTSNKRLHTSEVPSKVQSLTADNTDGVDHPRHDHANVEEIPVKITSRGILGTLRNLQHKDLRRRWVVTSPSLDTSKMPSPCEPEESGQRSLLEDRSSMVMPESLKDRISKRLQARSLSSRYGDFTFDPSPRQRRRNGRYSSVCMSSAESTPLFNAPAPSQGQVLVDAKSQPASWRNTIDPLASSSLMLATVELDRLTNRKVLDQSSEVLGSGQSSACGEPSSSPAMKSLALNEKTSSRLITTSCASERSMTPISPLPLWINMRSGNSMSQSTIHGSRRQRMTSSRFSDVRTPENILEASDEDVSSTTRTPGDVFAPRSLNPGSQPLYSFLNSPTEIAKYGCTMESGPGPTAVPVDRVVELRRSSQNDPSKCFWASTSGQRESIPAAYDNMPLNDSGQTQARKSPTHHLHTGALTPENTRGLWSTPRKSPSPPR